jgi:hypothetical protein
MKGYIHKKCKTELEYEQVHGMRVKTEKDGKYYYSAYCPKCKIYIETER